MVSSWEHGGDGAKDLAQKVVEITNTPNNYAPIYDLNKTLKQKIETVAKEIYRAGKIEYSETATKKLAEFELNGYSNLPICIAKTQNSISADSKLIGAPQGHLFEVKDVRLSAGAGFVVVLAGNIMTMPGLPVHPAAENIDVDEYGKITGLF